MWPIFSSSTDEAPTSTEVDPNEEMYLSVSPFVRMCMRCGCVSASGRGSVHDWTTI